MTPTPYLESEPDLSSLAGPSAALSGDRLAGAGCGGLLLDGNIVGDFDGVSDEGMLEDEGVAAISGVSATGGAATGLVFGALTGVATGEATVGAGVDGT